MTLATKAIHIVHHTLSIARSWEIRSQKIYSLSISEAKDKQQKSLHFRSTECLHFGATPTQLRRIAITDFCTSGVSIR